MELCEWFTQCFNCGITIRTSIALEHLGYPYCCEKCMAEGRKKEEPRLDEQPEKVDDLQ